jgi:hypothetical protein
MLQKKYQIFVSSPYSDLKKQRSLVNEAIVRMGHIPAGMELFRTGQETWDTIRPWIRSSDYFLVLLARRYGTVDQETGLSFTHREVKYALKQGIPTLSFLLETGANWTGQADSPPDQVDALRKCLKKTTTSRYWCDDSSLVHEVQAEIHRAIQEEPRSGWIRGWYFWMFALALLVPLLTSSLWTGLCLLFGWPYLLGQKGVELQGWHAAVWGFVTFLPIFVAVARLRKLDLRRGYWAGVSLAYGLCGAVGGFLFYNSGVRSYLEATSLPSSGRELLIIGCWSIVTPLVAALAILLPRARHVFDPHLFLRHALLPWAACWVAFLYFLLVARGQADGEIFVPMRGLIAHVALSAGSLLALVSTLRTEEAEVG